LSQKIVDENSLRAIIQNLKYLLYGEDDIWLRYEGFRKNIKGFGSAILAEILAFVFPDKYGIWNDSTRKAFSILGINDTFHAIKKSQLTGAEYAQYNAYLSLIMDEYKKLGIKNLDLLGMNYILSAFWDSTPNDIEKRKVDDVIQETPHIASHSEVIDRIVSIGEALGFKADREKSVVKGAKVDVIWQANIANLGVVMYVFEVQSKGSIDSLILNLQRALVNQSVQRLIVVADDKSIDTIRGEIAILPENFRRAVSYWEISDVNRAYSLVNDLFSIISKLELVKSEFGY
jgi:hypothetical protein